ncbi:MAG: cell division protein FtsL [Acidobacteria bacterium]|nr:cell division protein FtsL [Acidobacteriota bacterium]
MAACTATLIDARPGWTARVSERNASLLAQQPMRRRGIRTPEVLFTHSFDNSRLVKAADPVRAKQMRVFAAACTVLFSLIMVYGLQHFYAIETSYRIESEKQVRDQLREDNRQLRLSEAQLSRPGRIDGMARQLGLAEPQPGQVVHGAPRADSSAPVLAENSNPQTNATY